MFQCCSLWAYLFLIEIFLDFETLAFAQSTEATTPQDYVETTPFRQTLTTGAQNFNPEVGKLCSGNCSDLNASCYNCKASDNCKYGSNTTFECQVVNSSDCMGNRTVSKEFQCRYCFLTIAGEEHTCVQTNTTCKVTATPRQRVRANCTVHEDVYCLGNRHFTKMMPCSWTSGYSWSTALALSITVGGFGADRFYLGYWREGLGKFFSFGGLGVWTLIDAILIGTGYLGPADSSLYVY